MSKLFKRTLFLKLKQEKNRSEITVIIGSRQVGKTTLMRQLESCFKNENEKTLFLDLDLVENLEHFSSLNNFFSHLRLNGISPNEKAVIFIDEFQQVQDSTKLLKNLYDHYKNFKFYVSGSSSLSIQDKMKESLAGRKTVYHLHPLNFFEFLTFKEDSELLKIFQNWEEDVVLSESVAQKFYFNLNEFLIFGGYPKVVLENNKERKILSLKDIFDSYVKKDIKGFLRMENIVAYNRLLELLAADLGNLLNLNKLTAEIKITRDFAEKFLFLLEETFIINLLRPFYANPKKEIIKMPKIYFEDTGLRNLAINNFNFLDIRQDKGTLIENFVFSEIIRSDLVNYKINFWRTKMKSEVDFILEKEGIISAMEVRSNVLRGNLSLSRGLKMFIYSYNPQKSFVLNKSLSKIYGKDNAVKANFVPYYFISKIL